jgi:hypothetical protein
MTTTAWVFGTRLGLHAEIVPSSLAKRNRAAPTFGMTKRGPPLKTIPVGAPATETIRGFLMPWPL